MKCESTDLEIETIVNRIKNGDMDLQPDLVCYLSIGQ